MAEQLSNNAQTTVASGLSNLTNPVTFVVASAAAFPTAGNFRIIVDAEILLVTAVAGTSFTASRAQEGTGVAAHANGTAVTHVLTAGSLRQVIAESPVGYMFTGVSGTVGGGEQTLGTWTIPANTVVSGSAIHVTALVFFNATANAKTLRFYVGGSVIILNPTTAAPNSRYAIIDLWVWYQTATSAIVSGSVLFSDRTIETIIAVAIGTAINFGSPTPLNISGQGTATNDVMLLDVAMLPARIYS